jgi:outer membrane receptor protein involved in Fe transport
LKFETNLFYYDMENAQRAKEIRIFTPSGRRVGFADLFNVPKARTYGAEGQLRWQASPRLSASMAIGLLRTKVIETDSESIDLKGNEFDRSPRFTGSAAIDWRPTDRLRISAHARHHGPYYSDPENSPAIQIKSGTTVDGRAHYRIGRYSLFAQVRNVFNAFNLLDLSNPLSGEAEDPRRISVGIESDF